MKKILKYFMAAVMICSFTACNKDDNKTNGNPVRPETYDMTGFAKGADVSWLTEQEAKNSSMPAATRPNVCSCCARWA